MADNSNDKERQPISWLEIRSKKKGVLAPFAYTEWICEWAAFYLRRWALLDILDRLGRLTLLVALVSWLVQAPQRAEDARNARIAERNTKIANAWAVLNTAQGKSGSGGRVPAIADLISEHQSLDGIDLSNAYLKSLKLPNRQSIERAQLQNAYFEDCALQEALMFHAILDNAEFVDTSFGNATLIYSHCNNAVFNGDTWLNGAEFTDAICTGAEFNAVVTGADFTAADLRYTKLARLRGWEKIKSIRHANIYGVVDPPDGFVEWARANGAVEFETPREWLDYLDGQNYYTYWIKRHYQ